MNPGNTPSPQPAHHPAACLNCGAQLLSPYCGQCGQKADTHRFTLAGLVHEVPHAVLHVDRGLLPTLKALFTRPGVLIQAYLQGQRARYFNPLTLLVISASVCGAVWALLPFQPTRFWSGLPAEQYPPALNDLLRFWFKAVGLTQLLWLPLLAWWLQRSIQFARVARLLQGRRQEREHAVQQAWGRSGFAGRAQLALEWLWLKLGYTMHRQRQATLEVRQQPAPYLYGEMVVAAAFVTAASLLLNAAVAPLVFFLTDPLAYKVAIAAAAVVSSWPAAALLRDLPAPIRSPRHYAVVGSAYFVLGTPYGFLAAVLLHGAISL